MSNEQWAILRKRLYNALPYVPLLLVAYGVMSENMAVLWVSLVAQLIGPAVGHTAAHYVDILDARYIDGVNDGSIEIPGFNVSRETSQEVSPNVSRETITAPCVVMHGTAEPHVLGCDGWSFDRS
jgi:hypothetical protein